MSWFYIFEALFLSTCAYALLFGGGAERVAALTFILASVLTLIALPPAAARFRHAEFGVLAVDAAVLAVMLVLSARTQRFWPIWMAAMQAIQVLQHLAMLLGLDVDKLAYWRAAALWSYPMLVLLAAGTWRHRRRLKAIGTDPSWRASSGR